MEQDDYDKIFKGLAIPQQDVAKAYMENTKHIKKTLEIVLERKLNDDEKDRLRMHSFNLALSQVAKEYRDDLEESTNDE